MSSEAPSVDTTEAAPGETRKLVLQTLGGIVGFVALMAFLFTRFQPELQGLGGAFVRKFGLAGAAFGTYLADGFSSPIPPQFYILSAMTSGQPQLLSMLVITAASLAGGTTGFKLAPFLLRIRFLRRVVERSKPRVDRLLERYGVWGIAIASLTPVPFSTMCYLAGLYRFSRRWFLTVLVFRLPRLVFFYVVIRWAGDLGGLFR